MKTVKALDVRLHSISLGLRLWEDGDLTIRVNNEMFPIYVTDTSDLTLFAKALLEVIDKRKELKKQKA